MRATVLGLFAILIAALSSLALGQDTAQETQAQRFLRLAREGSAVVKPQAARRFVSLGDEAAELILRVTDNTPAGLAALGKDLVLTLSGLEDARVRGLLWNGLYDPDFPWRPAAASGLAATAREGEFEQFLLLSRDAIAPVRAAALGVLAQSSDTRARRSLIQALADGDERPRRAAADGLAGQGERWALEWLWNELQRREHFFDRDTGRTARIEAARVLSRHLDDLAGFDPATSPLEAANQQALERIAEALAEDFGQRPGDVPPPVSVLEKHSSGSDQAPALIGLEVISCRRGEFFVRVMADDRLVVGLGQITTTTLAQGSAARLLELIQRESLDPAIVVDAGEARFFGEPGCDREVLHLNPSGDLGDHRVWEVSKGASPVAALRPLALGRMVAALSAQLPERQGLRSDVLAALEAVGGGLPKSSGD